MIAHPIILVILTVDVSAVLLLSRASWIAFRVTQSWAPEAATQEQLRLEAAVEAATLTMRWVLVLTHLSSALTLIALSSVLPKIVPGAMCGTGVLAQMGTLGERALVLRCLDLLTLSIWHALDQLDRAHPHSPLATASAKSVLVSLPLVTLAAFEGLRAFIGLDASHPTSCCAMLYDQVERGSTSPALGSVLAPGLALLAGTVLLAAGVLLARAAAPSPVRGLGAVVTGSTLAWIVASYSTLIDHLVPYHYGVLNHRCPWCLFLAEHAYVGYALLAALASLAFEATVAVVCLESARRSPLVATRAYQRARRSGRRMIVSVLAFTVIATAPALVYRYNYGVWIQGQAAQRDPTLELRQLG